MAKLNFGDIVALAKQGYKPADIKELMGLDIPEAPESPETGKEDPTPAPEPTDDPATEAKATPQPVEVDKDKEIEELKKTVAELQKTKQSENQAGNAPDPQEDLNDIVRSFM